MAEQQSTCKCPCHQRHAAQQDQAYWHQWAQDYLAQVRLGPIEQEILRLVAQDFRRRAPALARKGTP